VLQACDFRGDPVQSLPPLLGGGFVHVLVRSRTPDPHFLLQEFHEVQLDQPPLTTGERIQRKDISWFRADETWLLQGFGKDNGRLAYLGDNRCRYTHHVKRHFPGGTQPP